MKLNQLTFTRFIAAIAIVIFHYGLSFWPFRNEFVNHTFAKANIAVSYFFILSGFVMIIAYQNGDRKIDLKTYYLNRIARIYPLYFCALIFTSILIWPKGFFDTTAFLLEIPAVQAWVPRYALSLNYPAWSLSVEFLFYLLFPILMNFVYKKFNFKIISVAVLTSWVLSQIAHNYFLNSAYYKPEPSEIHNFIFYFPPLHLSEFLVGNLTGMIYLKGKVKQKNYDAYLVILSIVSLIIFIIPTSVSFHNGFMAIVFAPFILLLALNKGIITRLFNSRILVLLGEISYSIYLLQLPIFMVVRLIFDTYHLNYNYQFWISVLMLIAVSFVCYYLIEMPIRNLIKTRYTNKLQKSLLSNQTV